MIRRWTVWEDDEGAPLQVSYALLDNWWEVHREITLPCGPFHPLDQQRAAAVDRMGQWLRDFGCQEELEL